MTTLLYNYEQDEDKTSLWPEMSYNKNYNNWDFAIEDEECISTGMELYFVSSQIFDGAEIIVADEEDLLSNGFHIVSMYDDFTELELDY